MIPQWKKKHLLLVSRYLGIISLQPRIKLQKIKRCFPFLQTRHRFQIASKILNLFSIQRPYTQRAKDLVVYYILNYIQIVSILQLIH